MACTIIISAHKVKSDKRKPDGTDWDQSYFVLKMKYYTNANFPSTELHNIREFHLILLILFFQATADWILKFNLMITFALKEHSPRMILPCKKFLFLLLMNFKFSVVDHDWDVFTRIQFNISENHCLVSHWVTQPQQCRVEEKLIRDTETSRGRAGTGWTRVCSHKSPHHWMN